MELDNKLIVVDLGLMKKRGFLILGYYARHFCLTLDL
jgi:hypothetical protein